MSSIRPTPTMALLPSTSFQSQSQPTSSKKIPSSKNINSTTTNKNNDGDEYQLNIRRCEINILGWPTDTISIDHCRRSCFNDSNDARDMNNDVDDSKSRPVETVVVLIPGNPGQYDWYVPDMIQLLHRLGPRFSFRGVSHAGHGLFTTTPAGSSPSSTTTTTTPADKATKPADKTTNQQKNRITNVREYAQQTSANPDIPWTVDGQIAHKCAYVDHILRSESVDQNPRRRPKQFLFIGHSFGCFCIQRMLVSRPDILQRTVGCLYLMPFVRMKADTSFNQWKLRTASLHPKALIRVGTNLSRVFQSFSPDVLDTILKWCPKQLGGIERTEAREIAVQLMRQPTFVTNFFELGTKEIRDIPSDIDVHAYQVIAGRHCCPIHMLYTANDQWAPKFHMEDIQELKSNSILPPSTDNRISMTYIPSLKHDYVTDYFMSTQVVDWCIGAIQKIESLQSKQRQQQPLTNPETDDIDRREVPNIRSKL